MSHSFNQPVANDVGARFTEAQCQKAAKPENQNGGCVDVWMV